MSFQVLVQHFVQDLERCGASVLVQSGGPRKPAKIRVIENDRITDCLLFLWNITSGGGKSDSRPANERRIQVTSADKFPLELGRRTIIGGWSVESSSWGFWNVMRHTRFSNNSPSFQISAETLEKGFNEGVATQSRKTKPVEIVVSVSSSYLLWYVQDGAVLHDMGADALFVGDLIRANPEEERLFLDQSEDETQASRRFTLVETIRAVREAKFRPDVLRAYSHQCAICPISLNLVDAAHIIPVKRPHSIDEVTNGLALCRLHHSAYDRGLVGVKSDYSVVINPEEIERLKGLNFLGGRAEFEKLLRPTIRLPREPEIRPRPEFLKLGMIERNWPMSEVG